MSGADDLSPEGYNAEACDADEVLDVAQLRRIEAVHRGFLYQHLYAVGCLLLLKSAGGRTVSVERDEDVEIALEGGAVYCQIKTRAEALNRGDITGALARFEQIRHLHSSGGRQGFAHFRIVSNVAPSPVLKGDIDAPEWPVDVEITWPDCVTGDRDRNLPPAWHDLPAAFDWCRKAASIVPFAAMSPETLVLKLAAQVQYACTGSDNGLPGHTFDVASLPSLFEQIVEQLQDFPSAPIDYRPQTAEPSLESERGIRMIVGLSGAGKTAWAAQIACNSAASTAYFDIADLPGPAIASSLARELAARFLGGHSGAAGAAILPAASGIEMLRALNIRIEATPEPIVVIDNAHRAEPRTLFDITKACSRVRFVLLAQPWPGLAEAEALFTETAEWLQGWDADTVAAEFAAAGCRIDPATADRWRSTTAGMPLFVKNAARLSATLYGGDAISFASEVDTNDHTAETAQEIILSRVVETLSPDSKTALATLSLSTAALSRDEVNTLLTALPRPAKEWSRALRQLRACGCIQTYATGGLKLHDAVRILGRNLQSTLPLEVLANAQTALRDILLESFSEGRDLVRFGVWLRLLSKTGNFETLVDLATQEFFHEVGDPADLRAVLEAAADNNDELDDEGRFWTLDALAFWDYQNGERGERYLNYVHRMSELVEKGTLGNRERLALAMKIMTSAGTNGDPSAVETAFKNAETHCHDDSMLMRLLRYNRAGAYFHLGKYADAEREARSLYEEYYKVLGLRFEDIFARNPPEIIAALSGTLQDHTDNLKHLADCLDLYSMSRNKLGFSAVLERFHALKFYDIAGAYRSAVKTGQDIVDDFVTMGDVEGARGVIEGNLLPIIRKFGLADCVVPVRGQYAVVLAYCGKGDLARQVMNKLQPYETSLSASASSELQNQKALVEKIICGRVTFPDKKKGAGAVGEPIPSALTKVGRNEPCPCGSGKKYKKCCGA